MSILSSTIVGKRFYELSHNFLIEKCDYSVPSIRPFRYYRDILVVEFLRAPITIYRDGPYLFRLKNSEIYLSCIKETCVMVRTYDDLRALEKMWEHRCSKDTAIKYFKEKKLIYYSPDEYTYIN